MIYNERCKTIPFTWKRRDHCRVINWPNFIIVVSGNREVQAEGERWETVARVVRIHTTFIKFAILYWCNSYKCTNNEKIWNMVRITKLWHRDMKGANVARKMAPTDLPDRDCHNLQFIKTGIYSNYNKTRYAFECLSLSQLHQLYSKP